VARLVGSKTMTNDRRFTMSMLSIRAAALFGVAALVLAGGALPCGSALADDDAPTSVRVYSVGDLSPTAPSVLKGWRDPELVPLGGVRHRNDESDFLFSHEERPGRSGVAEWVGSMLGEIVQEGDIEASWESSPTGNVALRTTAEGHRRADAALTLLRRQLEDAVHVHVTALTLDGHDLQSDVLALLGRAEAGTLDPAGVERLTSFDRHGGRRGGDLLMHVGWWSVLRQVRAVRAIVDMDVEIAESSSIRDPIGETLMDGLRLSCLPLSLQDGRVVLRTVASAGDLERPLRQVSLGQEASGSVELRDFHGALVASEIVLAPGRMAGIVLWQPGGDARVLLLRLVAAPRPAVGGTLALLPAAALTRSVPDVRVSWGDDSGFDELDPGVSFVLNEDECQRISAETVSDALSSTITRDLEEGTAYFSHSEWMGGGTMMVRAAEDRIARVRRELATLEKAAISSVRVSIRIEERATSGGTRLVGSLAAPTSDGATLAMGAYRSLAYVADQDVEVANGANISDPLVETAVVGALANVRVRPVGDEYSLDVSLRVATLVRGPEQIAHATENVSLIERVVTEDRVVVGRFRLAPGRTKEIILGESALGTPGQLVAVVRVDRQ
jgi:hypothetical protein